MTGFIGWAGLQQDIAAAMQQGGQQVGAGVAPEGK